MERAGFASVDASDDTLTLPLRWRLASCLPPELGALLPATPRWPGTGDPFVLFDRLPLDAPTAALPEDVEVAFIRARTGSEVVDVATRLAEAEVSGLVFAPGDTSPDELAAAYGRSGAVAVVLVDRAPDLVLREAARLTEELVRRRVYLALLAHWRGALARQEARLARLAAGVLPPDDLPPRPTMAPLSVIEEEHLAGVLGLWWPAGGKPDRQLEVSPGRVARLKSRRSERLADLTRGPVPGPLSLLVVEDDRDTADSLRLLIETQLSGLGRFARVATAGTTRAAHAYLENHGPPDILLADIHLDVDGGGLELVAGLRRARARTVVLGKTAFAWPDEVRRMAQLGALSVWTSSDFDGLRPLVVDALEAADAGGELARSGAELDRLAVAALPGLARACGLAEAERRLRATRALVRRLEWESGDGPSGAGEKASLSSLRAAAARTALEMNQGNRALAAEHLDVDPKTLARLLATRPVEKG